MTRKSASWRIPALSRPPEKQSSRSGEFGGCLTIKWSGFQVIMRARPRRFPLCHRDTQRLLAVSPPAAARAGPSRSGGDAAAAAGAGPGAESRVEPRPSPATDRDRGTLALPGRRLWAGSPGLPVPVIMILTRSHVPVCHGRLGYPGHDRDRDIWGIIPFNICQHITDICQICQGSLTF